MSRIWKRVPQTVRPRSFGRVPVLLCVLVFGLTATTVYRWGQLSWTPVDPNPTYTATAFVIPRGPGEEARISLRHTDGSAPTAAECANGLAERYVEDRRAEWKRQTEGPYLLAREAADKAERERAQNAGRLEAFRRQLAEAEAAAKARLAARPPVAQLPPMIDNPQWLVLDRQLAEFEQRRDEMLVSRTPLHPAVKDMDTRLLGIKSQLAATPRQIARGQSDVPASPSLATGDSQAAPLVARADQEKLDALTLAAEKSAQARDDAELAVKKALREQEAGPEFTIEKARIVENQPPIDYGWRRLLWTTILTSILMTVGIGSMSAGARIEPAAASVAEVQADAGVPMAGMIPADYPLPDVAAIGRRQSRMRRALVTVGLILIVVCPALAIWGVMGISS